MALLETNERQTTEPSSTKDTATQRSPAWRSTFWQFLRYCLVGGSNTIIDLLMLNVLLWRSPTNNVLLLVVYNSVAYSSGAVTSFFLNKYWTFGHKQRTTAREVVRFAIILALEILSSNSLVWLAGKALQPLITNVTLWGNASKLAATAGSAILSYAFMRFWIFARGSQHRPKQQLSPLVIQTSLPQVVITGDLRLCVTELDAAHGPVTGSYSIETREMQEPLQIGGRGAGAASLARTTYIAFEMPEAQASQIWIYAVHAQVTNQRTSIVTGIFVQILVTPDPLHRVRASSMEDHLEYEVRFLV